MCEPVQSVDIRMELRLNIRRVKEPTLNVMYSEHERIIDLESMVTYIKCTTGYKQLHVPFFHRSSQQRWVRECEMEHQYPDLCKKFMWLHYYAQVFSNAKKKVEVWHRIGRRSNVHIKGLDLITKIHSLLSCTTNELGRNHPTACSHKSIHDSIMWAKAEPLGCLTLRRKSICAECCWHKWESPTC